MTADKEESVPAPAQSETQTPSTEATANAPDTAASLEILESEPILVSLDTSCTRDVAVARLLGWMRGPIRRRYVDLSDGFISLDQMKYMHTLDASLADTLVEIREGAQQRLAEAFEAEADEPVMDAHIAEVQQCDELIYKAAQYMRDVDDELSKGANSALRLDERKTNQTGEVHITLSSLDRWEANKSSGPAIEAVEANAASGTESGSDRASAKAVESTFDEDLLSKSLETAYANFGLLMVTLAADRPEYVMSEKLNVSQLAKQVCDDLETTIKKPIPGHSDENLRKTFSRAIKAMEKRLRSANLDQSRYLAQLIDDRKTAN